MSSVNPKVIKRPVGMALTTAAPPFWWSQRALLKLIFWQLSGGKIMAHGYDANNKIVFSTELRSANQQQALIDAVERGDSPVPVGQLAQNDNQPDWQLGDGSIDSFTVVITDTGGDGPGPKLYKLNLKVV